MVTSTPTTTARRRRMSTSAAGGESVEPHTTAASARRADRFGKPGPMPSCRGAAQPPPSPARSRAQPAAERHPAQHRLGPTLQPHSATDCPQRDERPVDGRCPDLAQTSSEHGDGRLLRQRMRDVTDLQSPEGAATDIRLAAVVCPGMGRRDHRGAVDRLAVHRRYSPPRRALQGDEGVGGVHAPAVAR